MHGVQHLAGTSLRNKNEPFHPSGVNFRSALTVCEERWKFPQKILLERRLRLFSSACACYLFSFDHHLSAYLYLSLPRRFQSAYPINNKGIELQRTNEDVQTKTLVLFLERVYAVSIASLCECVRVCMREYVGACVQLPMQTSTFCFSTTYSCNGRIKQVCCIDYCQIGTDRWTDIFVLMLWYDSDAEGQKLLVDIWCTTEILCERKRIYLSNSKK